jgi:hypothetical protein
VKAKNGKLYWGGFLHISVLFYGLSLRFLSILSHLIFLKNKQKANANRTGAILNGTGAIFFQSGAIFICSRAIPDSTQLYSPGYTTE